MKIKVLEDFSYTPGPRYIKEGAFSGELFRDTKLLPILNTAISSGTKLVIDLDGTAGYGRSFLEETFGGLIRVARIPYKKIIDHTEIISNDEPFWKERISHYLKQAHEKEKI